jgi:ribosomal subunit interface protein
MHTRPIGGAAGKLRLSQESRPARELDARAGGTRYAPFTRMHLYLTARHFELTDAVRQYVEQRIVAAVKSHAGKRELSRIEVQLQLGQRDVPYGCHVLVQLPGHHDINITEEGKDMHAAIDLAERRLVRRLVDLRERRLTTNRHPRKFSWPRVLRALRTAR